MSVAGEGPRKFRSGQITWHPEHQPGREFGFYPLADWGPLKGFKSRVTCSDVPFRKILLAAKWKLEETRPEVLKTASWLWGKCRTEISQLLDGP